ncbi:MAG TPA: galactokinase [Bryobacterales bacterium]|nr:galactokinase [Bryobacterales bacterium]
MTALRPPRVFRAPGRVNLIGEHTDYNQGLVLPAALDLECQVTATPSRWNLLQARSLDIQPERSWPLGSFERHGDWSDYVAGVAVELARLGVPIPAAELEISSTVPIGAGLSSSAALEVSVALALCGLAGVAIPPIELALACQRAENNFVGMKCGIMDQLISLLGRQDHALLLDCRTLDKRPIPLPAGGELVIVNTMVKHELAATEYNRRRQECEQAAALLDKTMSGKPLRDATLAEAAALPDPLRRRARHVISENARVAEFVAACAADDLETAGAAMYASHTSLRDDFEVSCPELDFLVETARSLPGVAGARLTGGGFGGCTVNLVRSGAVDGFRGRIAAAYRERFAIDPPIYVCRTADGAGERPA